MESSVSFACPGCGAKVAIPEKLVRGAASAPCPACRTEMEIELSEQARQRRAEVERQARRRRLERQEALRRKAEEEAAEEVRAARRRKGIRLDTKI